MRWQGWHMRSRQKGLVCLREKGERGRERERGEREGEREKT